MAVHESDDGTDGAATTLSEDTTIALLSEDTTVALLVEHCTIERENHASLRGSTQKYLDYCSRLVSAFDAAFSGCCTHEVVVNDKSVCGSSATMPFPRIGAFEIRLTISNAKRRRRSMLVYSKLETRKWPSIKLIIAKIFAHAQDASDATDEADAIPFEIPPASLPPPKALPSLPPLPSPKPSSSPRKLPSALPFALSPPRAERPKTAASVLQRKLHSAVAASTTPRSSLAAKIERARFDEEMTNRCVSQIFAIGDCHAGRCAAHLSQFAVQHFHYGTMFTMAAGKRSLPSLQSLLLPPRPGLEEAMSSTNQVVCIFSYGTRDCRLHTSKWLAEPDALTMRYVEAVKKYAGGHLRSVRAAVPIILACPPAVDYNAICLDVETNGALNSRVQATDEMNRSLARACEHHQIAFTGVDTWEFAKTSSGSLRLELSNSGHTTIDPVLCGPVMARLREIILSSTRPATMSATTSTTAAAAAAPASRESGAYVDAHVELHSAS